MNCSMICFAAETSCSLAQHSSNYRWRSAAICCLALASAQVKAQTNDIAASTEELKQLSFEELMKQEVTMVSRRPEKWFASPSAVQVITGEEIRRSGATRIPEALRLASNLQVAQVDTTSWAISARGFNRGS